MTYIFSVPYLSRLLNNRVGKIASRVCRHTCIKRFIRSGEKLKTVWNVRQTVRHVNQETSSNMV